MATRCLHCGELHPGTTIVCGVCARAACAPASPSAEATAVFVGRQREMDTLLGKLDAAASGRGSVVMLSGEAGIGKTWMARELARLASDRGAAVLWGCCFEGDWQPAYGPWVEALGEFVKSCELERLIRLLGQGASTLSKLIPQISAALPDLEVAPSLGPDDERVRLYDAVIRFLQSLAEDGPVLLVIDDLHWADRDSLRLLRHLARSVPRSRLLLVGAYREPENGRNQHSLGEILPILRREADYQQVTLLGLSLDQVSEYLAIESGKPLPGAVVNAVFEETAGNPFFVRELLRHLKEEGKILLRGGRWSTDFSIGELGIPEGIRQLVHRRLARLSEETSNLLRLAAGFTGGFEFPVLLALTGLQEDRLLDCIDEGLGAGFLQVADHSPAVYDFAHAIVRHTLYDELNPDRRSRLHRRIALALEQVYMGKESERATELAHQYHASSNLPEASAGLQYAMTAAEHSRDAFAHERAATFLQMARDLASSRPAGLRADILCRLAVAEAEALMLQEAVRSVRDASDALTETGAEPRAVAEFLAKVARALKDGGAPPGVWNPLVDQGLQLLGGDRDLLWARLTLLRDRLEVVSNGTINAGRWLGHDPLAVKVAREKGGEDDYARTLEPLEWRSREETDRILAQVRGWTNPVATIRALDVVARDLIKRHGDYREAAALYRELLGKSERYGFIPGQAEALMQLAFAHAAFGEMAQAQQAAKRAQEAIARLGPGHILRFGATALASVLSYFLDTNWEESTAASTQFTSSPEAARNPRGLTAGAYAALGHARMGDRETSIRLLSALTPLIEQMEPRMYVHHAAIAFGASAVWETGASEFALAYKRLAQDLICAGSGDTILSHELTIARMAVLLGLMEEAEQSFAAARLATSAMGLRSIQAIVDYDQALALARLGSRDRCRILELARSAKKLFDSSGMQGWSRRASLILDATVPSISPARTNGAANNPNGLTGREVQVLRLLVEGKTNGEIAKELILSVRTVERHLANIYAKIGAHGRVDATTYAFNAGLASTQDRP